MQVADLGSRAKLTPATSGLIPDGQLTSLRGVAEVVDATFAKDLAAAASFSADTSSSANPAAVGHKRLLRLGVSVTTTRVRIRITGSRLEPTLAEVGLFQQALPAAPAASERSRDGGITLTHPHREPIAYTVDGTPPTARSPVYDGPVGLPEGGTLQAAVLTPRICCTPVTCVRPRRG
jgi:hypothetical protein